MAASELRKSKRLAVRAEAYTTSKDTTINKKYEASKKQF
jgi:hypothetical protein